MVEPVGNAPTRIVRLKAGCPSIVALTPLKLVGLSLCHSVRFGDFTPLPLSVTSYRRTSKLVLCSPRRLCVLPNVPVGSHLWGQLPITKLVDVVGFEPTTFRLRAEYSDPVELHIHKKLYLILSTNYNHLTTLYPPVNNFLKKYSEQINFI